MNRSALSTMTFSGTAALGLFARALTNLVKALQHRREVRNLAEFDERMLRDIGLTRDDVESALTEPLHHRPSWALVRCANHSIQAHDPVATRKPRPVVPFVSRT